MTSLFWLVTVYTINSPIVTSQRLYGKLDNKKVNTRLFMSSVDLLSTISYIQQCSKRLSIISQLLCWDFRGLRKGCLLQKDQRYRRELSKKPTNPKSQNRQVIYKNPKWSSTNPLKVSFSVRQTPKRPHLLLILKETVCLVRVFSFRLLQLTAV